MKSLHEEHGPEAIGVLQGMMVAQLDTDLPEGFSVYRVEGHPSMMIKRGDVELRVGLCDYHGAAKAIQAFCR